VESCSPLSQIQIQREPGLKFCRDFNIYVDPASKELIELGTLKFPFKTLGIAFTELFNFHLASQNPIQILIKEKSLLCEWTRDHVVFWMKNFTLSTYSEDQNKIPEKASIVIRAFDDP